MAEVQLVKQLDGALRPANLSDEETLRKIHPGRVVNAKVVQPRNPLFHRKFFALLNFAYEYWNPPKVEYKGQRAEKSFDRYRNDVTILAGYYTVTTDIMGNVKLEAKSISFAEMEDLEFNDLYKAVFNVLWDRVLRHVRGMTEQVAHKTMEDLLRFE